MTKAKDITGRMPTHTKKVATSGSFEKGHDRPGPGRPRGSQDRIPRHIKEAMLDGVDRSGEDFAEMLAKERAEKGLSPNPDPATGITAFFHYLALHNPALMCTLLARILPQQMQVEATHDITHTYTTIEQVHNRLRELGLNPQRLYPMLVHDAKKTEPTEGEATAEPRAKETK
jgi:hypothetical protein